MLTHSLHEAIFVLLSVGIVMASQQKDSNTKIWENNIHFALDMYRQLLTGDNNIFFSPFSVSAVMSMLYMGARGNTSLEMEQVMKIESVRDSLHSVFEECIRLLQSSDEGCSLSTANRLYAQKMGSILEEYSNGCKKYYHADIEQVNFRTDAVKVRDTINHWVVEQTKGKIHNLIPDGVLTPLTVLVIVNAIYFKGNWADQFDPRSTRQVPFRVNKNETTTVDMMYKKHKFKFGVVKELKCSVLELPYKGDHLRMIVVLPGEVDGMSALEMKLTPSLLASLTSDYMREEKVEVHLPKFKIETGFELKEMLSALGMKDLFDEAKADLSGIDGKNFLYVSKVIHKAFIEVNEEGTVAAAATAAVVSKRSIAITPLFMADHPFLFYIMDIRTGVILFLGRFTKPTGQQGDARGQQKVEL